MILAWLSRFKFLIVVIDFVICYAVYLFLTLLAQSYLLSISFNLTF